MGKTKINVLLCPLGNYINTKWIIIFTNAAILKKILLSNIWSCLIPVNINLDSMELHVGRTSTNKHTKFQVGFAKGSRAVSVLISCIVNIITLLAFGLMTSNLIVVIQFTLTKKVVLTLAWPFDLKSGVGICVFWASSCNNEALTIWCNQVI